MREPGYVKGVARREEMLTEAMRLIARGSFKRMSLREIARELDVDAAHLVYYFGSRVGLLLAVIERWDAETMGARAEEGDPDRPLDFFVEHVRLNAHVPGLVHLLHSLEAEAVAPDHIAHEFFRRRYARVTETVVASIETEIRRDLIPAHVDAVTEARRLIALADGLQLQALLDDRVSAAELLAGAVEALRSSAADPAVRLGDDAVPVLSALRKDLAHGGRDHA